MAETSGQDLPPATMAALLEATSAISAAPTRDETLQAIVRNAATVVSATAASVILLDNPSEKLVFKAVTGQRGQRLFGQAFDADLGIAGHVLRSGEAAMVNNVQRDPRFYSGIDAQVDFHTHRLLCAPLKRRGKVIGVVEVLNKQDGQPFTPVDLEVLRIFANLASVWTIHTRASDAAHAFVLDTEIWDLRFTWDRSTEAGRYPRSAGRGFAYYHHLLSRPFVDVSAIELIDAVSPARPDRRPLTGTRQSFQASIDRDALRQIYQRIREIKAQIEQSRRHTDLTEADVLGHELEQLRNQLQRDTGIGRTLRSLGAQPPEQKARESVRLALARARGQMARAMPQACHLKQNVRTQGYSFCYHQPGRLDWKL